MIEKIIVIVLVIAAAVGWILYARKEAKRPCEGCAECALKDKCTKKVESGKWKVVEYS